MASADLFTFRRPALAVSYCDSLEGRGLADSRSGLFLAAPRRTGKSTFLREDLLPVMTSRGWTTIYVDLWADRAKDPAALIASAIKTKIGTFASIIAKMAKSAGLEKINLFNTLSLNVNRLDLPEGITLADGLEALTLAGNAPVAIIIDEAQHALSTQAGIDAMFALKAARDHLNQGQAQQKQQLFIVLTGSNRDKLAHLVLKRTQPFFGSHITRFPLLDKDFTDAYTRYVNPQLAASNQFDDNAMFEAFKIVGHRPELLRSIIGDIALNAGASHLDEELQTGAEEIKQRIWGAMESEFAELPAIQRTVLEVIITQGSQYSPFSETSMNAYNASLKQKKATIPSVQSALDALREKGLVWRAAYGNYALEDESMGLWYRMRVD